MTGINASTNYSLEEVAAYDGDAGVYWNGTFYNRSTGGCDDFEFTRDSILSTSWFQGVIYFLYSTIFVVALIGNGLVCYVVCKNPRMKTVTNIFIVNLAAGDILMALFCVPTTFVTTLILQYWPFGPELCPVVNYFQAVSVLVSAYTLVAISIDRYIAIMWPLRPRMSKRQAMLLILSVWVIALIISLPIAVLSELFQPSAHYAICTKYVCQEVWPSNDQRYYYTMALLVIQYLIPIMVLVFTYSSIAIMVWGKKPPGEAENDRDQRMARSKRKMVKMMMTVVLAFTVCWLPFNILMLIMDNGGALNKWSGLPFVWMALHWLAMSHSCYNPVIYCWMNARFRAGFIAAVSRIPGVRHLVPDSQNNNYNASMAGIPLSGFEGSTLRRVNTCMTYVSVRRKTNGSHTAPVRSASLRNNEPLKPIVQHSTRHFSSLQSHSEEQI